MGVLLQAGLSVLRRRFAAAVSEGSVRRTLLGQPGICAVESVRVDGPRAGTCVLVRIQVAEGWVAQEVARREALHARLPVIEASVPSRERDG